MKSIIRKTIASISALAMTAAMTATTIPAFASEVDAIEAQNFVASYASEQEQAVAQYCADNCDTLEEAAEFMDLYEEGLALRASEESDYALLSTSSNTKKVIHIDDVYYNGTRVASTPHRMVLLAVNPTAALSVSIEVTWKQTIVTYDMVTKPHTICDGQSLSISGTTDTESGEKYLYVNGRIKKTSDSIYDGASTLCYFPIEITGKATSEAAIHSAFAVDTRGIYSTNGIDSDVELHTYALGDYDHNGIVNAADASYLLDLLTHYDIEFTYASEHDNIIGPVSVLAADANEDGTVSLADVTWINRNKSE